MGEGWGEGLRSIDKPDSLTRIASAIRPLPMGEVALNVRLAPVQRSGSNRQTSGRAIQLTIGIAGSTQPMPATT
jgi:hypothetical protein